MYVDPRMSTGRKFKERDVYSYAPRGQAMNDSTGKFVKTWWQGEDVRCRFVAQEFAQGEFARGPFRVGTSAVRCSLLVFS